MCSDAHSITLKYSLCSMYQHYPRENTKAN